MAKFPRREADIAAMAGTMVLDWPKTPMISQTALPT